MVQAELNRMKTTRKLVWTLAVAGIAALAATSGCVYQEPPPPPGAAPVAFVPDYYYWDGFEYVCWYGDGCYYWGPNNVWIICDPVRLHRADAWQQAHPHWRAQATATTGFRLDNVSHQRPQHPPPGRHRYDRDD
jgi:hypothetical protein